MTRAVQLKGAYPFRLGLPTQAASNRSTIIRTVTKLFDRTWSALTLLRAKVGTARLHDLMVNLPDALDEIPNADLGGVAEFHELLRDEGFRACLAEVTVRRDRQRSRSALGEVDRR